MVVITRWLIDMVYLYLKSEQTCVYKHHRFMHSHILQLSFMIFVFVHPTHPLTPLSIHIYNQSGCIYYTT